MTEKPAQTANFQHKSFTALQKSHAAHVQGSESGRKALTALHESQLKGFTDEEKKDAAEDGARFSPKDKNKPPD
jgi:hypothetical protein